MWIRSSLCALATAGFTAIAVPSLAAPFEVDDFGDSGGENPGNLEMWVVAPSSAGPGAPLVVVLHGCNQDPSDHHKSGFEELAEEHGFYLLYPGQKSSNNGAGCFNWFGESGDDDNLVRGEGENQSIAQMVQRMSDDYDVDLDRVYAVGLSAGAAMTAVLLATWPDVFAGGMMVAGVPYRCATSTLGAYRCMNMDGYPSYRKSPQYWGNLVRDAAPSSFGGPWPRVLVVSGDDDGTVDPIASVESVEQWTDVHGIDQTPESSDVIGGHQRVRHEKGGDVMVESWQLDNLGHAFPVDEDLGCGEEGSYYEDQDLCGAQLAVNFFGLTPSGGDEPDGGASGPDGGSGETGDGGPIGGSDGGEGGDGGGNPAADDPQVSGGGCSAATVAGSERTHRIGATILAAIACLLLARAGVSRRRRV